MKGSNESFFGTDISLGECVTLKEELFLLAGAPTKIFCDSFGVNSDLRIKANSDNLWNKVLLCKYFSLKKKGWLYHIDVDEKRCVQQMKRRWL